MNEEPCKAEYNGDKCSLKARHVSEGKPHLFLHYESEKAGVQWPLTEEEKRKS